VTRTEGGFAKANIESVEEFIEERKKHVRGEEGCGRDAKRGEKSGKTETNHDNSLRQTREAAGPGLGGRFKKKIGKRGKRRTDRLQGRGGGALADEKKKPSKIRRGRRRLKSRNPNLSELPQSVLMSEGMKKIPNREV